MIQENWENKEIMSFKSYSFTETTETRFLWSIWKVYSRVRINYLELVRINFSEH